MPFQQLTDLHSDNLQFLAFVPENLPPNTPIIAFMHGVGERGDDYSWLYGGGVDRVVAQVNPQAIMIFVQCTMHFRAYYGEMEDRLFKAIDSTVKQLNADEKRVYLMGYSMGASSALYLSARHPNLFAALACIAAGITWEESYWPPNLPEPQMDLFYKMFLMDGRQSYIAENVSTPVWLLHGDQDRACPIEDCRALHHAFQLAGTPVRKTEYPGVGHDSLLIALQEPDLFTWMLSHRVSKRHHRSGTVR